MILRVAGEGTDGLAWMESDSRFHGPVGSGRVGVGRRSEGASAKAMPATALNASWRSASLATVSTSGKSLPSHVLEVVLEVLWSSRRVDLGEETARGNTPHRARATGADAGRW